MEKTEIRVSKKNYLLVLVMLCVTLTPLYFLYYKNILSNDILYKVILTIIVAYLLHHTYYLIRRSFGGPVIILTSEKLSVKDDKNREHIFPWTKIESVKIEVDPDSKAPPWSRNEKTMLTVWFEQRQNVFNASDLEIDSDELRNLIRKYKIPHS